MNSNEGTDKFIKPMTPKGFPKLGSMTDDKGKGKGPLQGQKTAASKPFPYLKKGK